MKKFNLKKSFLFLAILGLANYTLAQPIENKNTVSNSNQSNLIKSITVTGNGQHSITTDIAAASLSVEAQFTTSEAAQKDVAKRTSDIIAFLRAKNVEHLKTSSINLYPRYDYENNKQKLIGYTASNSVTFQTNSKNLGTILDEAIKLGASRIDGIKFSANQKDFDQAKNQAITKAIFDAQSKAYVALAALNLKAKEVLNIHLDGASRPAPAFQEMRMLKSAKNDTPTPVEGGEENIEANVTLEIAY